MERLERRLGLGDSVVVGLGSMLGAGVFVAYSPAARAAGSWLLVALGVAAALAWCNAWSSARLAARHPESGGTYVYGRERLGPFWGHLAGWAFVVGKTASCAAMALTVGAYLWPDGARWVAAATAVGVTALTYRGVQKGANATRVVVVVVLVVLGLLVGALTAGSPTAGAVAAPSALPFGGPFEPWGVLRGAGFLFFAFAGYARLATLGEEVRDPTRTIPRAIAISLGVTVLVYAAVAASLLASLGAEWLGGQTAPLAAAAETTAVPWAAPAVRLAAVLAAVGALLGLVLGVSRTVLAMARDGYLPRALAVVHPVHRVPYRAEVLVGTVTAAVVLAADVRGAIGFSSFCVLTYYAVANASAWTLGGGLVRAVPALGLAGCLVVAWSLPAASVLGGAAVLALGVAGYALRGSSEARGSTGRTHP